MDCTYSTFLLSWKKSLQNVYQLLVLLLNHDGKDIYAHYTQTMKELTNVNILLLKDDNLS